MKSFNAWKLCQRFAFAVALLGCGAAIAQDDPAGYGHGMMGGPGMMGGYGMGPGMMYGGGCPMTGPGGGMTGPGGGMMMGMGPLWELNLNADQKKKLDALMLQQRDQHWAVMKAMSDNYSKLRTLYSADPLDQNAIDKVYDDIFKNQRAMIDLSIKSRNQIYGMLTPDQKAQLRNYRPGAPAQ